MATKNNKKTNGVNKICALLNRSVGQSHQRLQRANKKVKSTRMKPNLMPKLSGLKMTQKSTKRQN